MKHLSTKEPSSKPRYSPRNEDSEENEMSLLDSENPNANVLHLQSLRTSANMWYTNEHIEMLLYLPATEYL